MKKISELLKNQRWVTAGLVKAHLCTLAVTLTFNATWSVPRSCFRYGPAAYLAVYAAAAPVITLPVTLLQLAVGQLSQENAVGIWKAVPFFKGIGYIRLLVSFASAVYTATYVGLTVSVLLYTLRNSVPFPECSQDDAVRKILSTTECFESTFISSLFEHPEYFIAVAVTLVAIWILIPFLLFNTVRSMRRTFYALTPIIIILLITISASVGDAGRLQWLTRSASWSPLLDSAFWMDALVQGALSSQVTGGYLIATGDTLYASTNVYWTACIMVVMKMAAAILLVLFWYGVAGGEDLDSSAISVLAQTYSAAAEHRWLRAWPVLLYSMLVLSGVITLLSMLYPVFDQVHRVSAKNWRSICAYMSMLGLGCSATALAYRLPGLEILSQTIVPILASIATVIEVMAFVFIYGYKRLEDDIEFLIHLKLNRLWRWAWGLSSGLVLLVATWCILTDNVGDSWTNNLAKAVPIAAALVAAVAIILSSAAASVADQVQYDFCGKVRAAFRPSRFWGPRDPITHYYWITKTHMDKALPRPSYFSWRIGQLSGTPETPRTKKSHVKKQRSNSDDVYWIRYRKEAIEVKDARRSQSLDCPGFPFESRDVISSRPGQRSPEIDVHIFGTSQGLSSCTD